MLTPAELRRRWTIELNSLGRRERPTPEQDVRKRDLQIFLCYIDPLRKHEHQWDLMKDLEKKLERELLLQSSVSSKQYLQDFYGKLLAAMTGKAHGQPSDPCELNQKARLICEDHGERLENVLKKLHEENVIRKDYQNNTYSLSTVGANLMEKVSVSAIHPPSTWSYKGAPLASAIKHDSIVKLAELRSSMNNGSPANSMRDLSTFIKSATPKVKALIVKPPKNQIKESPAPKVPVIKGIKERIRELESKNCPPTQIFNTLISLKLITVMTSDDIVDNDPEGIKRSEWTSTVVIEQLKGLIFTELGLSRRAARSKCHERIIRALKTFS